MSKEELLAEFSTILQMLLGDETIELRYSTLREDVPDWDSLAYVNFIVTIEMKFNLKFQVADVEAFESVGEIVDTTLELIAR